MLDYDPSISEVVICSGWGATSDWIRNIRARPALRVQIGRKLFTPQHRFLTDDESLAVAVDFRRRHPHRVRFISRVLGWGDLRSDAVVRDFVATRPFVAFRPVPEGFPGQSTDSSRTGCASHDLSLYPDAPCESRLEPEGDEQP